MAYDGEKAPRPLTIHEFANGLIYIEETGEFRQGNKTLVQLRRGRPMFNALLTYPDAPLSYLDLYRTLPFEKNEAKLEPYQKDYVQGIMQDVRNRINRTARGFGENLETVPLYGYRWRSTLPMPTE